MNIIKSINNETAIYLNKEFSSLLPHLKTKDSLFNILNKSELSGRVLNYIIQHNSLTFVVRHYHRGGFFSFLKHKYFNRSRFINEFLIHSYLFNKGFDTVKPVAVVVFKNSFHYEAFYITVKLDNFFHLTKTFIKDNNYIIEKIKSKFYNLVFDFNIYHTDLQIKNILITSNDIFIIDFDKSKFISKFHKFYYQKSIKRFYRSLNKNKIF